MFVGVRLANEAAGVYRIQTGVGTGFQRSYPGARQWGGREEGAAQWTERVCGTTNEANVLVCMRALICGPVSPRNSPLNLL